MQLLRTSLPGYLTDNYKLPMEIKGCNVTWESSVQSVLNGFEIVADSHEQKVVLTAQIGSKNKNISDNDTASQFKNGLCVYKNQA